MLALRQTAAPALSRAAGRACASSSSSSSAASCTRGLRTAASSLALRSSSAAAKPSTAANAARKALLAAASPAGLRRALHASAAARETVKVPQMAESITEGTLKQWLKKKGDHVKEGDEIATIETDKIDVSVNAPVTGTITETHAGEEDTVTVGQDLCNIEPGEAPEGSSGGEEAKKEEPKKEEKPQKDEKKPEPKEEKKPEPKKEEKKPEPKKEEKKPEPKPSASSSSSSSSSDKEPAPKPAVGSREERRVKMSRMRMRIAERLKESQNTAASLTTFNEIDMSSLIAFRARHKDAVLKNEGVKLGFMSAFAKASALALRDIPAANARIEGQGLGDTIVYSEYVDLSVAVSTEKGLVTPVVRNVEGMGMIDIEREIARLGKKARDNKLTLEDMSGGTFTISNGGVFGSLFGTPILNLPGSAILGMHAVKDKPWVVDGKIEIRPIMVVALTYDHRLLDGREAVTFLVKLKQYIEDMPSMLL